jgi:hypothetical protein
VEFTEMDVLQELYNSVREVGDFIFATHRLMEADLNFELPELESSSVDIFSGDPIVCQICEESTEFNDLVECPFDGCKQTCCELCFEKGILSEAWQSCIFCKRSMPLDFILKNNSTEWLKTTFLPRLGKMTLQREIENANSSIPRFKLKQEIDRVQKLIKVTKEKDESYELRKTLKKLTREMEKTVAVQVQDYVCPCPTSACRGFIRADMSCELCTVVVCNTCRCVVDDQKKHKCDPETAKAVAFMEGASKPCPKCRVVVAKAMGCNQMFCTHCKTVFDWGTMTISNSKHVHNPHYFEWREQNQQNNGACEDINDLYLEFSRRGLTFVCDQIRVLNAIRDLSEPDIRTHEDVHFRVLANERIPKGTETRLARVEIENAFGRGLITIMNTSANALEDLIRYVHSQTMATLKMARPLYETLIVYETIVLVCDYAETGDVQYWGYRSVLREEFGLKRRTLQNLQTIRESARTEVQRCRVRIDSLMAPVRTHLNDFGKSIHELARQRREWLDDLCDTYGLSMSERHYAVLYENRS